MGKLNLRASLGGAVSPEEQINRMSRDKLPTLPLTDAYGDIGWSDGGAKILDPERDVSSGDPLDERIGDQPDMSGPTSPVDRAGLAGTKASQGSAYKAPPPKAERAPTPEELMRRAEEMMRGLTTQRDAQMARGPATANARPVYGSSEEDWLDRYMAGR